MAPGGWEAPPPPAPGSDVALVESAHRPGARDRGPPWAACLHPAQPEAPKAPLAGRNLGALTCQPCQSQNVRAISPNEAIGWSQEQARSGGHIDKLARPPVDGRHLGVIGRLKARPAGESGSSHVPHPSGRLPHPHLGPHSPTRPSCVGAAPPPPGRPPLSSSLSNLPAGAVPLAGGWAPDSVLETHLWGQSRGSGLALYPTRYFHPHRGAPGPTGPRGGRPGLRRSSLRLPQGPPPQGPAPGMGWPRPGSSMPRGRDHAARPATVCVVQTCPGGVCRCGVTEESGLGVPSR